MRFSSDVLIPHIQTRGVVAQEGRRAILNNFNQFYCSSAPCLYNQSMQNTQRRPGQRVEFSKPVLLNARSAVDLGIDPNRSYINTLSSKNFEKYQVIVENEQLESELKCIEWRSKTEFPIVKILFYKMLQKKLLNECSVVQVAIENFPSNLNTLPKLHLHQILYLMKEALVGFERLFDRFGLFDITNRMILINKNSKCRVWMNENITLNFPSKRGKLAENDVVAKLVKLFEEKCVRTPTAAEFFAKIAGRGSIVEAMHYLENFTKVNRIVLANRLNLANEVNSPKRNLEKQEESLDKNDEIFACGSLKKIPKFILQLREERKPLENLESKSHDSPKKKIKEENKERSLAKTAINKQTKDKSDLQSQSKSNISPLSQISADLKKQTKSTNQNPARDEKVLKPAVRELLKQNSQQNINTYATMVPISKPYYGMTEKRLPKEDTERDIDLTLTKLPQNGSKRPRKLSNEQSLSKIKKYGKATKPFPIPLEHCNLLSSQQTATTTNSIISNRKLTHLIEKPPEINILLPLQEQEESNIFEKNGWMKRVNNLTCDKNFRDTLESHYQGHETFSSDYLLTGQTLGLLGKMGKDLKGSIIGS